MNSIIIDATLFWWLVAGVAVAVAWLFLRGERLRKEAVARAEADYQNRLSALQAKQQNSREALEADHRLKLAVASQAALMKMQEHAAQEREQAKRQIDEWKATETEAIRQAAQRVAYAEAQKALVLWKQQSEMSIRSDAITRSRSAILGRVSEQLVPYHQGFPFNPKDARFIGSPIDLIVFDGCDDGEVKRVVFVEVKTGRSGLSARQRAIRDAVQEGRVEWLEYRVGVEEPSALAEPQDQMLSLPEASLKRAKTVGDLREQWASQAESDQLELGVGHATKQGAQDSLTLEILDAVAFLKEAEAQNDPVAVIQARDKLRLLQERVGLLGRLEGLGHRVVR